MQKRITVFDTIRGFTMLSMAGFHACYDLAYLYGWEMPWFTQTIFQDIWRASISWVFLFIAGWMCTLSRNNIKRAAKYAASALVVWISTTLVSVDGSVNFGIIYCMAACTAIVALASTVLVKVPSVWAISICLTLFALTLPPAPLKKQIVMRQHGPMRIPSRRSQASDAMHCRSTCFINRLSCVYWS